MIDTITISGSLMSTDTIQHIGSIDVYDTVNLTVSLPSFVTIDGVGSFSFLGTQPSSDSLDKL